MVLDDWDKGFSVHKLSLEDLVVGGGGGGGGDDKPQRLPAPVLSLSLRAIGSHPRFHAVGSNLVVFSSRRGDSRGLTLVYDMETAAMEIENSLPRELERCHEAMAAGDKLYAFRTYGVDDSALHCLRRTQPGGGDSDEEGLPHGLVSRPQPRWAWERIPVPPPRPNLGGGSSSIFADRHSLALHPDGRTLFASIGRSCGSPDEHTADEGTFSLDTATGEWTRLGDWLLPFNGHAHYDGDLGAWVGTHIVYSEEEGRGYEHLCTCEVPAPQGGATPEPAWMVGKERLTFLESSLKPTSGRALVRAGGSMFCLVEPAVPLGFTCRNFMGAGDKCHIQVTMFRAKYGRNGELLTVPLGPGRSYIFSRHVDYFGPNVFWV
ncbi:hypothetical protein ACQ4PT_015386 [Festuca glaucescens]